MFFFKKYYHEIMLILLRHIYILNKNIDKNVKQKVKKISSAGRPKDTDSRNFMRVFFKKNSTV